MTATRPNPALIRKLIDERETAYRLGKTPCILWVRVSTAKDEQEASFLDQQELALRYAERNGMHVCHVWAVKETGSKADKRKNFQELVSILSND
ncbi:MAG TPA: recombinase family protein, partial [Leptospiraceae bacterium]|nr:recombinase family protein [Leptospiraceae bacterium]